MKSKRLSEQTLAVLSMGLAVAAGLLLLATISRAEQPAPPTPQPAPSFSLKGLDGKEVKLSDFDGKALLVFFWTTSDKWCQEQLKSLTELQQQYGSNEFSVLGMALDSKGVDAVKSFAANNKINFPIVRADYQVVQGFGGLQAIPTIFVVEKGHRVIQKHVGVTEKSTLENDLKSILAN